MVLRFSAALGAVLCTLGASALLSTSFHAISTYSILCMLTGIMAASMMLERRRVVRRVWTLIGATHALIAALGTGRMIDVAIGDVVLSATIAAACFVASRRLHLAGSRRRHLLRFDTRLGPERAT